jgi:16S rRNA (cytosine967-C5)-methyltransferase
MSRFHSYLNSATRILGLYKGDQPFAAFLKQFFAQEKKYGSGDRKAIAHLCYCYFRLGQWNTTLAVDERVLTGLFLVSSTSQPVLDAFHPEWNEKIHLSLNDKLETIESGVLAQSIFPWKEMLSDGIDFDEFNASFLQQPDLFIRLRPGRGEKVIEQLTEKGIQYYQPAAGSLAFSNTTKLDDVLMIDKDVVIQDLGSQEVSMLMNRGLKSKVEVWDCCAASGGKSIMAYDLEPTIKLTVTDIRETIIANLRKRFDRAGIAKFDASVLDLNKPVPKNRLHEKFSLIIADMPCSGSGTWARTPEQLYYFKKEQLEKYTALQESITTNALPFLKPGGYLLYVTCSVFATENEDRVSDLMRKHNLELIDSGLLKGYNRKADTLFNALLQRPVL